MVRQAATRAAVVNERATMGMCRTGVNVKRCLKEDLVGADTAPTGDGSFFPLAPWREDWSSWIMWWWYRFADRRMGACIAVGEAMLSVQLR